MLFSRLSMFCALMIIRRSSQNSLDFKSGCFPHSLIHSKAAREGENTGELYRQKRQVVTLGISPAEYTVAIEMNFSDSSLQESLKSHLKKLSFPLLLNVSDSSVKISSINVSTACNSTGTDSTHCYCEHGYEWPAEACASNPTCPKAAAADERCHCIAQLPSKGTYCQLQSEDTSIYVIEMTVRLDQPFQDDLRNSSSTLFKKYKRDLEEAFIAGYSSFPGFKNVTVTEFRPGSIMVPYKIVAARDLPVEMANTKIAAALKDTYNLINTSFGREISDGANFSVSPEHIFEGDTVKMTCESKSATRNVSWDLSGDLVSNNTRHSIMNDVTDGKSVSTLTITSIQLNEAGNYTCAFMEWGPNLTLTYKAKKEITVFQLHVVPSENVSIVCNGESKELRCCTDADIELTSYWKPNGAINISGSSTSINNNCTTYMLRANESQCPADKSGTKTDYTCELNSTYGARNYSVIGVTYFRVANVNISSSPAGKVSEGHKFSVSCISDVSNYDKVTWQIQSGNSIKNVDNVWYTTTKSERGAMSVLTVDNANQKWTGIYICTFFQSFLNSSARLEMDIVPLPLQQDIIRDPIDAFVSCPMTQELKCCTHEQENYTVKFYAFQRPLPVLAERREHDGLNCYYYTRQITGDCDRLRKHGVQMFCEFTNQINGSIKSLPMILNLVSVKDVRCNSSAMGVGENGALITKPCLQSNEMTTPVRGNITYKCDHEKWTVARNNCLTIPINKLLISAELLVSSPEAVQKLPAYLESLNTTIKKEQKNINMSVANLKAVVEILNTVSIIPVEANRTTMKHFLSTVDTVMASPTETWKDFKNGSSQLLDSVERFSKSLQPLSDTIPLIRYDNIQLDGTVIGKNNGSDYNKSFRFSKPADINASVLIDETKINRTGASVSTIISVAYSTFGHINAQYNETADLVINGLVLTTVVSPTSKLGDNFQINMTFAKSEKALKNPRCVFWNFSFSADGGGWDDAGCESREDAHQVVCSCNHLTSFSILMSPSHEDSWDVLTYITYIGLGISMLSLMACIGIELAVWKSVTKTRISYMRHVCILNIAISLLIADIWFVVVAVMHDKNYEVDQHICTAATFFIHYFYLCVFFWMLTLGLMLFYHLVFILHNASKTIMKALSICLGYVCPLAISIITIASTLSHGSYTKKKICLLNWENSKALLALVIPAMIIVAINAIVTIVVVAKISRRSIGEKSISEEKKSLYRIAKSIGVLTPLLGLTWGFGFATVFPESPKIFHILFTIFNSFQGLFILLCGTFWDRKVREAILNKCSLSRWSSQHTKSTSQGMSAPMLSISSPFSRTLNNLFGKAGKYQVSSTESASSSSENTSKTYSLLT
nr:adhesion G protein-coupled receptor F5 isoform X1 [Pogona vitticeps]XP_020632977.1 adhesion G protein-coupled receptor F5 isoform X1 [Pogona vitticeps]XP_020632978.1 adhesion G protein-coupled receptor F5 isoform X1 [Pogona vitticeps]XP_020632979.1 adhesion G protein-coupled receptor F5 isoform X1 [Pogona vitticeps]XP_020632980.1 adhesion G protein-coupled receptor F5 isoform X1 [Pogona vitticeps]XP_020632981.1 adhesion G protein-coupled receptor F5 isoform X2 [Pogona vitticeps]